jgi:nifR3 family TIM-barrel protein
MKNFWQKIKKPILALAPMAGITDEAFRYLCGKFGADVVYSEMISATAMVHGSEKTWNLMKVYKKNGGAKFVVQLFGNDPAHFVKAVKLIEKRIKPDGFDINFGCPAMKIIKSCAGAKLFQDLEQSRLVIDAVLHATKLPVSIKIRASAGGRNAKSCVPTKRITALEFMDRMKDLPIAAVMIHGRTLVQGFSGEVDYGMINRVKKKFKGIILANGGINNSEDAENMLKKTNADGLGIGQGACGHPWIFSELKIKNYKLKIKNIFKVALEHAKLMEKLKGKQGILEMRKHLCWYVKGMPGAAEMRKEFVKVETLNDIKKLLKQSCTFLRGWL